MGARLKLHVLGSDASKISGRDAEGVATLTPATQIRLRAVTVEDGGDENAEFAKTTPVADLTVTTSDPVVIAALAEPGSECFADFTVVIDLVSLVKKVGDAIAASSAGVDPDVLAKAQAALDDATKALAATPALPAKAAPPVQVQPTTTESVTP